MRFHMLGAVEIGLGDDTRLSPGSPKEAAVLAALLLDAGRPLSTETLVDRVWGEQAHDRAQRTLHTYVTRIRRLLEQAGAGVLVRRGGGYLLQVDRDEVDMHLFRRLVDRASRTDIEDPDRVVLLGRALALWRGDPLAGVPGEWASRVRTTWQGYRTDVVVAQAQAYLRLGDPTVMVAPLTQLLDEHPMVEPLAATLIQVLHATGRTAEALSRYADTRLRLIEELGVEPGAHLRAVHQQILRDDADDPAVMGSGVPALLPLDVHSFTGRGAELRRLDAALAAAGEQPTSVVIAAVTGTAGVGKTALAVHWGHSVRHRFPDGQLYINLRGFDPVGATLRPVDALRGFLEALAVGPQQIPVGLEARSGRFRSLLADRRMLIVLDNASTADQVRPLLPGSPGSFVVITSRNTLPGLIAVEGAQSIELDLPSASDARGMLMRRIDPARSAAAPEAVDRIVSACARLPLALSIAAARAATRPEHSLHLLAGQLVDARNGLDAFTFAAIDPVSDVRAVFSWSYRALSPAAARLFRRLGLPTGPDVTVPAAASLAGLPVPAVRAPLEELADAHLLTEYRPGRYTHHDLLRAYAAERAEAEDSPAERAAALDRLLDHYLHTAIAADRRLHPHREPVVAPPPAEGATVIALADRGTALAWYAAEHQALLGALDQAANTGRDVFVWHLAWAMGTYVDLQGHWADWARIQRSALDATTRLGDRAGQAFAHRSLGLALAQLGAHDQALKHLGDALAEYGDLGDRAGQAHTHNSLARVYGKQDRPGDALVETQAASRLFGEVGQHVNQARALNNVGWYHAMLGAYEDALACCIEALKIHQRVDDGYGEANTWDSIGYVHHCLNDHPQAVTSYHRAIDLWREVGDRYNEADTLTRLGDTYLAADDRPAALAVWEQALSILTDLDHPDQPKVRAKLRDG
ncbi:BTAD domain-containing putative transcriptional regulator [Micromonospora chokoriensis]